jgi:hypothetical protein
MKAKEKRDPIPDEHSGVDPMARVAALVAVILSVGALFVAFFTAAAGWAMWAGQ